MQILLIALVVGLFIHDALRPQVAVVPQGWAVAMITFIPLLVFGAALSLLCKRTARRITRKRLRRVEQVMSLYRLMLLPIYAMQLWAGLLVWLRLRIGDLVLLDELLVILPTLATLAWSWWCYYPLDKRLRESAMIQRMDRGLPVYPVWTRKQYLLVQLRVQILLLFVPLAAILAWIEASDKYLLPKFNFTSLEVNAAIQMAGSAIILVCAPLMIRLVLDTVPLPPGELRDRLTQMCRVHRIKVQGLLLWRTFGGVTNAAVMGVIAPLRYIMLTDALLDSFPKAQVEAVMAHELAHVRKHHMFWLLGFGIVAASTLDIFSLLAFGESPTLSPWLISTLSVGMGGGVWLIVFGWASRRMERQADGFAAAHFAREKDLQAIDEPSAAAMILALERVAELNHLPTTKRSWRHGSIRSRQDQLRKLVGCPINALPTDRAVRQVQWLTLLLTCTAIAFYSFA